MKATELLKTPDANENVQTTIDRYANRFDTEKSETHERVNDAAELSAEYYNLATDFYLSGWGRMFHFGPRKKGESLKDSLVRYEMYLAEKLQLKEGEKSLDLGCGVGGPMVNIAKRTKCNITGINISAYQIEKGRKFIQEAGIENSCSIMNCDWMNIPLPDQSFDKAYGIEAICHAADKRKQLFLEVNRLLKPGALFASYDWVMTEKYNPNDPEQVDIKRKIEIGDGIANLNFASDIITALEEAGFEVLESRDMAQDSDKETPWYLPFKGEGISPSQLLRRPLGILLIKNALRIMEMFRLVPKGTSQVHRVLELAAQGLVKGGEKGIFTPMYFFLAKKRRAVTFV